MSQELIEKINIKEEKAWKRTLEIEISAEKVNNEFERVFKEYKNKARIKGFRQGKAPMEMIKKKFKEAAAKDVIESLIPPAYDDALRLKNITPVTTPKITEIEIDIDSPLKFKAEIEIRPEIEVKDYQEIALTKKEVKTTDEDVDKNLKILQDKNAVLKPTDREAQDGDYLLVDLEKLGGAKNSSQKAENQETILDSKKLLTEFYRGLLGTKPDDEKEIEAIYPKDHHDSSLAGKIINYKVKVKEVKERVLPELNDEFARSLGDFKDLNDLKQKIKDDLERKAKEQEERDLKNQLIREVVKKNSFDVPQTLLKFYLDSVVARFKQDQKDMPEDKIREQYRELGENRIRWEFLMHQIADKEKIDVTQTDIDDFTRKFAENYNLKIEQAKEFLARQTKIKNLKEDILEEKVLDFLLKNAVIRKEGESKIITL